MLLNAFKAFSKVHFSASINSNSYFKDHKIRPVESIVSDPPVIYLYIENPEKTVNNHIMIKFIIRLCY